MRNTVRALRRIDAVLDAQLSPDVAYPMRARLGRALLEVGKVLTEDGTQPVALDRAASEALSRLQSISMRIMQPSEPFDSQWRQQWADVILDLRTVRLAIAART
jgi:hypothetical protein